MVLYPPELFLCELFSKRSLFSPQFRFSSAHTIAQFAKKALSDRLPGGTPSKAVISGFVFVCRQLYNACDGLMVLNPYELHQFVANAWIKVSVWCFTPEGSSVQSFILPQ